MITVVKGNIPTRAVVILYGWLGSIPRHVQKYAQIYLNEGCSVVYGTAHSMDIMFRIESRLSGFALESVRKAATIIREQEALGHGKIPVGLHYFSNGGAFVAETLTRAIMIQRQHQESQTSSDAADLILVADRLRFEVCDSAPAYLHSESGLLAIDRGVSNPLIKAVFKAVFRLALLATSLKTRPDKEIFWENAINSDLCKNQAFIYSVKDALTDHKMIDDLIIKRKERGIHILVCKFEDSDHVQHLLKHPNEYKKTVMNMLEKSLNTGKTRSEVN